MGKTILVTGSAGFIGFHTTLRLLERGNRVIGFDSMNNYYDPQLKRQRLSQIYSNKNAGNFKFVEGNLSDAVAIRSLFAENEIHSVVNLAAQVGVRYSVTNPQAYVDSNLVGYFNVIDASARARVEHFVYASSSSVYGMNAQAPFSESQNVDHPLNLYAATKKSNELIAHSYAHLFSLPCTGLRFFTVYGPWGRPDMAVWLFTEAISQGKSLKLFNEGKMLRDFTYVDDIVDGILAVLDRPAVATDAVVARENKSSSAPYRVLNIGNHAPVEVSTMIQILESLIGKKAIVQHEAMHAGDMQVTCADTTELQRITGVVPRVSLEIGLKNFVNWYQGYCKGSYL